MDDVHLLTEYRWVIGQGVAIVGVFGLIIACKHLHFFCKGYRQTGSELSRRMRNVFATDAFIYAVILGFGVRNWLKMPDIVGDTLFLLQFFSLVLNVWAAQRLFKHMRMMGGD